MALFSGLLAVALVVPTVKADLPPGTWKVQDGGRAESDLVITGVKPDGTLCGTAFGQPLDGRWDGTVLSFHVRHDRAVYKVCDSFSARLVREQQGAQVRYTLTGMHTHHISGCYIEQHRFNDWKAHLEAPGHEK
jgi:hypothetical protein